MSFIYFNGIDTAFPFGSFEGSIMEENSNELRLLMRVEHGGSGQHGANRVALWRGLCSISDSSPPTLSFGTQAPWPQAGATITRLGVGRWRFNFVNSPLFMADVETVTPAGIASGMTAYVSVQDFATGSIFTFEVHTKQGDSTTLDYADLPFVLTVYAVTTPEPAYPLQTEAGDDILLEDGTTSLGF